MSLGPQDSIERDLEALPRPVLERDLAPGVLATLRREVVSGRDRPGRWSWAFGGLALGVVLGALFSLWRMPWEAERARERMCRVWSVEGEVVRLSAGMRTQVQPGAWLMVGDGLQLGPSARAELDLDPDARLRLHPGTRLQVLQLESDLRVFQLDAGRLTAELLNGGKRTLRVLHAPSGSWAEGRQGSFEFLEQGGGQVVYAVRHGSAVVSSRGQELVLPAARQIALGKFVDGYEWTAFTPELFEERCPPQACPACPPSAPDPAPDAGEGSSKPPATTRMRPPTDEPVQGDGPEELKTGVPTSPDAGIKGYQVEW
jgi:hypothetical protein